MNDKTKILIVEDEPILLKVLADILKKENFDVFETKNGLEGLEIYNKEIPDIIIADVIMPEMDGFRMVKKIREQDLDTKVLFLTALSSTDDLVKGFESGGNDYLKKPFDITELVVRVKALSDRILVKKSNNIFEIGSYLFNAITQKLIYTNHTASLTHLETEILRRLCINRNNIVENKHLLIDLWNNDDYYTRNSLNGFIFKLRKLLSKDKRIEIINLNRIGYKLVVNSDNK